MCSSDLEKKFDFIICPGNATPALPHKAMHDAVSSCGYTFLWNLLDYPAGIIPVTKVDPSKDALPSDFKPVNGVEVGAYKHYDAVKMAGLPCAIQVVGAGKRLIEEEVLGYMEVTEQALKDAGVVYKHLNIEDYMEDTASATAKLAVSAKTEKASEGGEPTYLEHEKGHGDDAEISPKHEHEIVEREMELLGGSS